MAKSKKSPKAALLRTVFDSVRKNEKFWGCWRTADEQWIGIIRALYPETKPFDFTKSDLSTLLSRDAVYKHCFIQYGSLRNEHGVYIDKFRYGNIRNTAIYCCAPNMSMKSLIYTKKALYLLRLYTVIPPRRTTTNANTPIVRPPTPPTDSVRPLRLAADGETIDRSLLLLVLAIIQTLCE